MSQQQTLQNGEGKSTSSQGDFLANLSPSQVNERERMITATSGRTFSELYEKSDPLGLLVKMLVESSRWYSPARRLKWDAKPLCLKRMTKKRYSNKSSSSKPSVRILSVRDIPSNRYLFRLVPSERPTAEIESGLLPTVQTQGLKVCNQDGKTEFYPVHLLPTPTAMMPGDQDMRKLDARRERVKQEKGNGNGFGVSLNELAKKGLLPTPMASDATTGAIIGKNDQFITTGNGTPRKINQNGTNGSIGLGRHAQMFPTPQARDFKGQCAKTQSCLPNHFGTSQLNPLFVAEMMGFPPDWTVLPFQNGDKKVSKDSETQ